MFEADSYKEIIEVTSKAINMQRVYLIISGINKDEGIVIEKHRYGVYHTRSLDSDAGIWFLV